MSPVSDHTLSWIVSKAEHSPLAFSWEINTTYLDLFEKYYKKLMKEGMWESPLFVYYRVRLDGGNPGKENIPLTPALSRKGRGCRGAPRESLRYSLSPGGLTRRTRMVDRDLRVRFDFRRILPGTDAARACSAVAVASAAKAGRSAPAFMIIRKNRNM